MMQRLQSFVTLSALLAAGPEAKGPLAGRPSQPGPHLEKAKALGDNAWLNLGKPAPDPKYGVRAQARGWGRKMAFAPDLRGAFLYGEGVHGGVTQRGSRIYYNCDSYFLADAHCVAATLLIALRFSLSSKLRAAR
jgi:hypothetical protein